MVKSSSGLRVQYLVIPAVYIIKWGDLCKVLISTMPQLGGCFGGCSSVVKTGCGLVHEDTKKILRSRPTQETWILIQLVNLQYDTLTSLSFLLCQVKRRTSWC